MTELERAVLKMFLANEAFAEASFEESDAAGERLMAAEDAVLEFGERFAQLNEENAA